MINKEINKNNFWPDFIKAGDITYPAKSTLGPRIQRTIEFVLLEKGYIEVRVDGKKYKCFENSITILFPGHKEFYSFSKKGITKHSYIHISFPSLSAPFIDYLYKIPKTIPISTEVKLLSQRVLDTNKSKLFHAGQLQKSAAVQLFWQFIVEAECISSDHSPNNFNDITEMACDFIESNLNNDLTLSQIASAVAVCPEHLIRIFKSNLSKTPIYYLWERRTKKGIELLENSGLAISLIAEQNGFKTRNHFSRKVKELTGYSPRDLRKYR